MRDIKDQADPGIHLVDVLAAWFAAARKGEGQLAERNQDIGGDFKHSQFRLLVGTDMGQKYLNLVAQNLRLL